MTWKAVIAALFGIFNKFLGYKEAKEINAPLHESEKLDKEAAQLRERINAAFDLGNTVLMSELQTQLTANYRRAAALRNARSHEGGKGN